MKETDLRLVLRVLCGLLWWTAFLLAVFLAGGLALLGFVAWLQLIRGPQLTWALC